MNKRLKSPISVQIEMTSECTSACVHCYNFWRQDRVAKKVEHLSRFDSEKILQKLASLGVFNIILTGGEPLLNYSVTLDSIRLATELGMGISMNSNLMPITKERVTDLKRAGLTHILTSILGHNALVHDKVTQHPNSFRKLVEGIKTAQDGGLCVSTNMVVSKVNLCFVRDTIEIVKSLGIKSFMATKAGCPGNCRDFSEYALSNDEIISFLNDLCWAHDELGFNVDTLEPVPLCALNGVKYPELFAMRKCSAGVNTATISYDGTVRPCSHLSTIYGNVFREEFEVIWSRMDSWSQEVQIPSECTACNLMERCKAGCRAEGESVTGRVNGLDPYTRLSNVQVVTQQLTTNSKDNSVVTNGKFRTTNIQCREELFGGVVYTGKSTAYLDNKGYDVVKQLKPWREYNVSDCLIDWQGLDPEKFIAGLGRRGVVLSIK